MTTNEVLSTEALGKAHSKGYSQCLLDLENSRQRDDEEQRTDPLLRLFAARLVARFGDDLLDIAADMAKARGSDEAFERDECAGLLLWQFAEFIGDVTIPRQPHIEDGVYASMRQPHQCDYEHADTWFDIEPYNPNGSKTEWRAVLDKANKLLAYDDGVDIKTAAPDVDKTTE